MLPRRVAWPKIQPSIICATGNKNVSSEIISIFENECVVVASGVKGLVSNDQMNRYVSDTAIWYYTQAKRKPYIWKNTVLFGRRLIKSVNTAFCKEKKRLHIQTDVMVDLLFVRISKTNIISYDFNTYSIFLLRDGAVLPYSLAHDNDSGENTPRGLGLEVDIQPRVVIGDMRCHDVYLFLSKEVGDWLTVNDIQEIMVNHTQEELSQLIDRAKSYGCAVYKTMLMIKAQSIVQNNFLI